MSSGSDAYSLRWIDLTSTRPFRLQRTFQRLSASCNRITWSVVIFQTVFPKSRCVGVPRRLIVSPSCGFYFMSAVLNSSVLGVRVLSFPTFSVRRWISSRISNSGGCHHKIGVLVFKRWIPHQFWCCPCRTCPQVFRFRRWFHHAFCCHFNVWNLDFSLFFHRIDW